MVNMWAGHVGQGGWVYQQMGHKSNVCNCIVPAQEQNECCCKCSDVNGVTIVHSPHFNLTSAAPTSGMFSESRDPGHGTWDSLHQTRNPSSTCNPNKYFEALLKVAMGSNQIMDTFTPSLTQLQQAPPLVATVATDNSAGKIICLPNKTFLINIQ